MDSLPPEVQQTVAECLCPTDLKSLRLVNKRFSNVAARPLFEVLNFSGNEQSDHYGIVGLTGDFGNETSYLTHLGRKRTVKYAELPKAVEEVLPLAKFVKTFKFSPAYYRENFWRDYRVWLINETERPISEVDWDPDDSDEEYEAAEQRLIEERISRPDREEPLILVAEQSWNEKIAEQNANATSIGNCLVTLFKNMHMLCSIEIGQWTFNSYDGIEVSSWKVDNEIEWNTSQTIDFLETLARALSSVESRIEKLILPRVDPNNFQDTAAIRYIFSGLKHLRLQLRNVDFLREDRPQSPAWVGLFKCAQKTLQTLEIAGSIYIQLPDRGSHTLLNMLGTTEDSDEPLVYPELQTLRVKTLILSTPPLIEFLNSQPKISDLHFSYTYLHTPNQGWPFLARAFPRTVQFWTTSGEVGHEPILGDGSVAYNWCRSWNVLRESSPTKLGWKYTAQTAHSGTVIEFQRV